MNLNQQTYVTFNLKMLINDLDTQQRSCNKCKIIQLINFHNFDPFTNLPPPFTICLSYAMHDIYRLFLFYCGSDMKLLL